MGRHARVQVDDPDCTCLSGGRVSVIYRDWMAGTARRWGQVLTAVAVIGALTGCAVGGARPRPSQPSSPLLSSATTRTSPSPTSVETSGTPGRSSRTTTIAAPFDADSALGRISRIASLGPRDATSRTYASATAYVAGEFSRLGYHVRRQEFPVPAGTSWGIRVPGGTSANVIAEPIGFDSTRPHLVVGAHLDTVPQAPGAEDNASGVAVMLELARMLREQPARLPVRLVAFGAEEARGRGPSMYAFGSRAYVAALAAGERTAVRGMVALDRVGVRASAVPVCFGRRETRALADALRRAARDVPTTSCLNRASDHVSFEAAGIPAARVGSVPYAAYHSARDVPSVIDRRQLERSGGVVWAWLRSSTG